MFGYERKRSNIMFGRELFGVEREREIRNNYVILEENCSVMRERIDTRCNYVILEENCSVYERERINYNMHRLVEATKLGYKRFCRERYEYQQMIDCR